jgi:hypothetical protein
MTNVSVNREIRSKERIQTVSKERFNDFRSVLAFNRFSEDVHRLQTQKSKNETQRYLRLE